MHGKKYYLNDSNCDDEKRGRPKIVFFSICQYLKIIVVHILLFFGQCIISKSTTLINMTLDIHAQNEPKTQEIGEKYCKR